MKKILFFLFFLISSLHAIDLINQSSDNEITLAERVLECYNFLSSHSSPEDIISFHIEEITPHLEIFEDNAPFLSYSFFYKHVLCATDFSSIIEKYNNARDRSITFLYKVLEAYGYTPTFGHYLCSALSPNEQRCLENSKGIYNVLNQCIIYINHLEICNLEKKQSNNESFASANSGRKSLLLA